MRRIGKGRAEDCEMGEEGILENSDCKVFDCIPSETGWKVDQMSLEYK